MRPALRSALLIALLSVLFVVLLAGRSRRQQVDSFAPGNGWVNEHFDSVFVISSAESKSRVQELMSTLEITPDYVKRVAAKDLQRQGLLDDEVITEECTLGMADIVSNMSHLLALDAFQQTSDVNSALILEDVAVPCGSGPPLLEGGPSQCGSWVSDGDLATLKERLGQVMAGVPNDWDVINLGRCWDRCADSARGGPHVLSSTGARCRHAYAVTRGAAEKIQGYTKTLKGTAAGDEIIAAYALAGKLKVYVPDRALFVEGAAPGAGPVSGSRVECSDAPRHS